MVLDDPKPSGSLMFAWVGNLNINKIDDMPRSKFALKRMPNIWVVYRVGASLDQMDNQKTYVTYVEKRLDCMLNSS